LIKYREANGGTETELTLSERARLKAVEREVQELRVETAFLKKLALTSPGSSGSSKYEFIDSQKNDLENLNPVSKMCRWSTVSTS